MSFCRWSSEGGKCDVYVYADVKGGYTCHIAHYRVINIDEAPPAPTLDMVARGGEEGVKKYLEMSDARHEWIERHGVRQTVPHGMAGQTVNLGGAEEMALFLERLKSEGVNVPQYAIDELREEADEG